MLKNEKSIKGDFYNKDINEIKIFKWHKTL